MCHRKPPARDSKSLLLFTFYLASAIWSYAGSHVEQLRAAQLGVRQKTTQWTAGMRKYRSFADGLVNGSNRPFADLQNRPYERAVSARKRSSAEGEGCANGPPPTKLRHRLAQPCFTQRTELAIIRWRCGRMAVTVAHWLHDQGLAQYEKVFRENAIDLDVLSDLTDDD